MQVHRILFLLLQRPYAEMDNPACCHSWPLSLCPTGLGQLNLGSAAGCSSLGVTAPLGLQPGAESVAPNACNDLSRCQHCSLCSLTSPKVELESIFVSECFLFLSRFHPRVLLGFFCLCFLRRKQAKLSEN